MQAVDPCEEAFEAEHAALEARAAISWVAYTWGGGYGACLLEARAAIISRARVLGVG